MIPAPTIDARDRHRVLADLLERIPGYVPELAASSSTGGGALMNIFARYAEILIGGLNQVPDRHVLALLDMLGVQLLGARAARAPLVFTLIDDSPEDVELPANSPVAARPRPSPPSPSQAAVPPSATQPLVFATTQPITLARSRLASLYSIDPASDQFADHTPRLTTGFSFFDGMALTEHAVYLGHDHLFALAGKDITVLLSVTLEAGADAPLKTTWEYRGEDGWLPLERPEESDTTQGLRGDGQIVLHRRCGPNAKRHTIAGRESFWLRGRLTTPMPPETTAGERLAPVVNDITARLSFSKWQLAPEAAFADLTPLDVTKEFYPFGAQPAAFSVFYIASKEVFQRKQAKVTLAVTLAGDAEPRGLALNWEYYNGSAWTSLAISSGDASSPARYEFAKSGTVSFVCPSDWKEASISGIDNYWLRVRITAGDYGLPAHIDPPPTVAITDVKTDGTIVVSSTAGYAKDRVVALSNATQRMTTTVVSIGAGEVIELSVAVPAAFKNGTMGAADSLVPSTLHPPVIKTLTLGYTYLTDPEPLHHCLSLNDFVFEDQTDAALWPDRSFVPFKPVRESQAAVHLGFDRLLPTGLVSLYLDVPDSPSADAAVDTASPFVWEYRAAAGWTQLGVLDETAGFRRSGMIQFVGPPDAVAVDGAGGELFRVRARLKQGERARIAPATGIWLNAVWGTQRTSYVRDILGGSDGNPNQAFRFPSQRTPVLDGEIVEVQEWTGRGETWRTAVQDVPDEDLRFDRDPATGGVVSVWVTWHSRPTLYRSRAGDRHYALERATGKLVFGDGRYGMVPPAGTRIAVSYSSGGGPAGNVPAGAIAELRTAVPFIRAVTNPVAASGGAATESIASVRPRGAQRIRHRDRAVSAADVEWIAREASPDLARVRCLPLVGPGGHAQRGWITVAVAPQGLEAQPQPGAELRRRVRAHLAARVPATVAGRIRVIGLQYIPIGIRCEIVPVVAGEAALVEARVRERLDRFLHPLAGGLAGEGWQFGEAVYLSQVAAVVERTPGVDYAKDISLRVGSRMQGDRVDVPADALPAAGEHEIRLMVGEG